MWSNTEDSFLWLHGKAGAGKSVLAASVIESLENSLKDGEVLVFFYCDFRNERSTSAAKVMRSILSQLLLSDVMLLHARYVFRLAKQFSQQPFIVINALDECKNVEELLDALKESTKGGLRSLASKM
ncbi:hypothetical protein OG21DRAFT_1254816 [Imleria badia]|nr:hypothetical protein OG21DRAFT_1254816 [Imleria badia]